MTWLTLKTWNPSYEWLVSTSTIMAAFLHPASIGDHLAWDSIQFWVMHPWHCNNAVSNKDFSPAHTYTHSFQKTTLNQNWSQIHDPPAFPPSTNPISVWNHRAWEKWRRRDYSQEVVYEKRRNVKKNTLNNLRTSPLHQGIGLLPSLNNIMSFLSPYNNPIDTVFVQIYSHHV